MRGLARCTLVALAFLSAGAIAARACEGRNVQFEDDFAALDPTWKIRPDQVKLVDGKMVLSAKPESWLSVLNTTSIYDNIDMCADVTAIEAVEADTSFVGLIFWYSDDSNFYTFEIRSKGEASAWRLQRGKWLRQVGWNPAPSVHDGDGASNRLRVVTVGSVATLYINGEKFREMRGQPPADGQEIGVIGSSPKKGVASYAFDNLKITEPAETPPN